MSLIDPFGWFLKKRPKQKAFWEDNEYASSGGERRGYIGGQVTAYGGAEQVPLTKTSNRQDV